MASLNQLAEVLAERVGRQTDITFREELKVIIDNWRARLIRDSLQANPKDRPFFSLWFELPLISVPISSFPGFPQGCCVLRTKCKLPNPVRANGKLFDFVGSLNKSHAIPVRELWEIKAAANSKYSGRALYAAYMNNYLYIIGGAGDLPGISVNMIPEYPDQVSSCMTDCGLKSPYDHDKPYPAPADIQQRIVQAILSTELRNLIPNQEDEVPVDLQEKN